MDTQNLRKALTDAIVRHQQAFEELNKVNDKILSEGHFILTHEALAEYQKLADKEEETLKEERATLDAYFHARGSA